MAKILLVHPLFLSKNPAEQALAGPYFPLGLLYLAGYVRENGHEVAVFDATFETGESAFAEALDRERPDVVGVSILAPTRQDALSLTQMASAWGATVIAGGPDPTASPAAYVEHPSIDLVVHHEGERTITRLLDLHDDGPLEPTRLGSEPGVAYRDGDRVIVNQPNPPIEELDDLPLPARDLIDMDRYLEAWQDEHGYSSLTIATSRGCPYGCDWCRDAVHGNGFRQRSPESVAAEVQALAERYEIDRLRFVDDVDGIDREWFERWASAAEAADAAVLFEPLNESSRPDLPLLDVRDSL